MTAEELKLLIAEIPDDHEIEFVGDIDGEVKEVTFGTKPCSFKEFAWIRLTKPQIITVECKIILRLPFNADSKQDAINQAEEFELPSHYKEDSFDILRVIDEKGEEM